MSRRLMRLAVSVLVAVGDPSVLRRLISKGRNVLREMLIWRFAGKNNEGLYGDKDN